MPDAHVKVAVTGAAGQIGYALLFRIASGQMFGPRTTVDLHMLELEAALPALEGVAMELQDCAFPLLGRMVRTSSADEAFAGVNWALLVGAVPRKAGMERKDLLTINGGIFSAQGRAIARNAAPDVHALVVGNPCNTNGLIAAANAPEIPSDRWFAMTMLDENRGRSQLAAKAGVAVDAVRDLTVWGNHSSTQFPDFYHATIAGHPATEAIPDEAWLQGEFMTTIQQRGAAIPAPEQGGYGVPAGIVFGYPLRAITPGQIEIEAGIVHNDWAQGKVDATLAELLEEREAIRELIQ